MESKFKKFKINLDGWTDPDYRKASLLKILSTYLFYRNIAHHSLALAAKSQSGPKLRARS